MNTTRFFVMLTSTLLFCPHFRSEAADIQKGTPAAPGSAAIIAGSYYQKAGESGGVSLTLNTNGTYTAAWSGCMGQFGQALGHWSVADKRITLTPSKEEVRLRTPLRRLDVLQLNGQWILLGSDSRDYYD